MANASVARLPVSSYAQLLQENETAGAKNFQNQQYLYAVIHLRKALAMGSKMADLDTMIGMSYLYLNQFDRALPFLNRVYDSATEEDKQAEIRDSIYQTYLKKGDELSRLSIWDQAVFAYQGAKAFASDEEIEATEKRIQQAMFSKGSWHASQNHFLEAAQAFAQLLQINSDDEVVKRVRRNGASIFIKAAKSFEEQNQIDRAIVIYKLLVQHFGATKDASEYAAQRLTELGSSLPKAMDRPIWIGD